MLVLLPTSSHMFLVQWQGPYPVTRRVGSVNYEIDMVGRRKRRRIFHVNMLWAWNSPIADNYLSEEVAAKDVILWGEDASDETPVINDQLSEVQKK